MSLYAIGDLHLSLGAEKPMDVFGGAWSGYMEKLKNGLSVVRPEDTTVILGDHSWAIDLEQAKEDFSWINEIPGRKILLKGNHDYWWSTAKKFYDFCLENGFSNQFILNNNHYVYEDIAICGTRGWFYEKDSTQTHDDKVFQRELLRLEASLQAAGDLRKIVFLHYPPLYKGYCCDPIIELFHKYDVKQCFYGHLHGPSHGIALEGLWDGVEYHLVSADYLNFSPYKIIS